MPGTKGQSQRCGFIPAGTGITLDSITRLESTCSRGRSRENVAVPFFFSEDECSVIGSLGFFPRCICPN